MRDLVQGLWFSIRTSFWALGVVLFVMVLLPRGASAACTSPTGEAGQIQWISASSAVKYCNGTSWVTLYDSVTATACSTVGSISFTSGEIMYCNGTYWVKSAPATNHGACVAGDSGKFYYDTTGGYYWFCTGSYWRRMGP